MVEKYYKVLRHLGREPLGKTRKERISRIYPDRLPEDVARAKDERRIRQMLFGFALSLGLAAVVFLFPGEEFPETKILSRPEPGAQDEWVGLDVRFGEETVQTEMRISSRDYTEAEKEAVLDAAERELKTSFLGGNLSADEVTDSLDLSGSCAVEGVEAYWIPREPEVLHHDGSWTYEAAFGTGRTTALDLYLSFEGMDRHCQAEVTLVEPETDRLTAEEMVADALEKAERESASEEQFLLPDEIAGTAVTYQFSKDRSVGGILLILGILAAAALFFLPEQQLKEEEEVRSRELECGYSELVSRLCVLVGAGLSVRGAWEQIVSDYKRKKEVTGERHYLYEEMERALRLSGQGISEERIYSQFGKRCGSTPYLKLGGLLESHIKNGTRGFTELLSAEAEEAFRQRLQLAKRQGEEISAKLMLPMLILFALIAAMLVIPAFLSV